MDSSVLFRGGPKKNCCWFLSSYQNMFTFPPASEEVAIALEGFFLPNFFRWMKMIHWDFFHLWDFWTPHPKTKKAADFSLSNGGPKWPVMSNDHGSQNSRGETKTSRFRCCCFFFQHFGALEVWLSLEGKFGDTGDVSPEILPQGGGLCSPEDKIFHGTGWDDITKTQEIRNHVRLAKVQKLLNMGVSKN